MKEVIEILERHYKSFFNKQNPWNFFKGLSDYVGYIDETAEFKPFILRLARKKEKDFALFNGIEKKTINDLNKSKQKLLNIIKSKNIQPTFELEGALRSLKPFDRKSYYVSSRPVALNSALLSVARALSQAGYEFLLDEFIEEDDDDFPDSFSTFVFSDKLDNYIEARKSLDRKKESELWSDWDKLCTVYVHVNEDIKNYYIKKLKRKTKSDYWNYYVFLEKESEMNKIRENKDYDTTFDRSSSFFNKENYKIYSERIHNYLLRESNKIKGNKDDNLSSSFDEDKGILNIGNGIAIKFSKYRDQYNLLRIIFGKDEQTDKEWFFDEISEKAGGGYDEKKFYNASYQICKKIASESEIKDYFITTTHSVKINPKYL